MATFLHIDTTHQHTFVGLSSTEGLMNQMIHTVPNEQAKMLNTLINDLLSAHQLTIDNIDAIVNVAGPGSYTGVRVGMATAKGLAFAKDIPLIALNRLDVIAHAHHELTAVVVWLKARVGEVFLTKYENGAAVVEPIHLFTNEMELNILQNAVILTDDLNEIPADFQSQAQLIEGEGFEVATLHQMAIDAFDNQSFADLAYVEPFYMKEAFTTVPKKNKLL